jgi:hypothetical protein
MKFYIRQFKDDFIHSTMNVQLTGNSFVLSWFKSTQVVNLETNKPETTYPTEPTASASITPEQILTERKTSIFMDHPHQVIACGVSEDNKFVFVDVLKHTFNTKGSTGSFKNSSNINPIMYIFVPFADSPMDEWTFIGLTDEFTVDTYAVDEQIDIDINRTLAQTCAELLPNIALSIDGNEISAKLVNLNGTSILKADVEIYFETTAGYLTKSRSKTDEFGVAKTEVIGALEGKVKAGFKNFSGKAQLSL